jgi:hypothetical protein
LEEADALFAASATGATRTRIRKATGLDREQVGAALGAAKMSGVARETAQAFGYAMTLEQLALLAEFDGDEGAVSRLTTAFCDGRSGEHVAERIRQERAELAEHERLVEQLRGDGYAVTTETPPGTSMLHALAHDGQELTSETHATCPARRSSTAANAGPPRLMAVADEIKADVAWLRSLCTAQFWDSGAGQAFGGQVDDAAGKLAKAHDRYLAAGQALGSSLTGPGYAGALDQAQSLSLRALNQAQQAWPAMRAQLACVEVAGKGFVPYAGAPLTLFPAQPQLDSSGNPVLMVAPAAASTQLRTAVSRYNASALEYRTANGWLAEAVAQRDAAAARAAAAIAAAIGADGLEDQTGLWHDITSAADAAFGWGEQHWAQVVGDIATVCGWIATALGVLALIFAFICPPLAAALEGMALTLTEVAAVCHLILAIFGKGSWADLGLDMVSLATFGWGRNLLRAGEATVEVADEIGMEGIAARADLLSEGLAPAGDGGAPDIGGVIEKARNAEEAAITLKGAKTTLPGLFGKLGKASLQDFKPASPVTAVKAIRDTDWKDVLGERPVKTITAAVNQAVHMRSPEFASSQKELKEVPGLATIMKLTGINFPNAITHYNRLWAGGQIGALTIDAVDKADAVVNYFHEDIPGYDWVKEHAKT